MDTEGTLLYSVVKEVDFATNLSSGPYSQSAIGRAWKRAMEEEDGDAVVMENLEHYLPSRFEAAGFLASPVFDATGEQRLGVLLFQFPLDRINTIVQDRQGMEESSEVVLGMRVGDKLTYLNELLFSQERPLEKWVTLGTQEALPMQQALSGAVSSGRSIDYQQREVLAAWTPVTRLGWGLVAKVDREQALLETTALLHRILFSLLFLAAAIVVVAWRGAAAIVNPIDRLSRRFEQVREGDFSVRAEVRSRDELGRLAEAFNQMAAGLYATTTSLDDLNEILASMSEGVLVVGSDERIEHSNPAFSTLSGYSPQQLDGEPIEHLFGTVERDSFQGKELLMKTADRGRVSVLISRSLLTSIHQERSRSVLVCRDLTERKRVEQHEQDAAFQAGIAEMSASILHNIGNTVTGASSQLIKLKQHRKSLDVLKKAFYQGKERIDQLLAEEGVKEPEQIQQQLEWEQKVFTTTSRAMEQLSGEQGVAAIERKLEKSIHHISGIISLQQRATRDGTHVTQFLLEQTIVDALEMLQDRLESHNIEVQLLVEASLQHVKLPRNPFIQMVLNLLKNAMESILQRRSQTLGVSGRIEVNVSIDRAQSEAFLLTVRDNGVGIAPEVLDSLFLFGFTTKAEGSGFGLHASANFINSLGGTIEASSDGVDQGALFQVRLPLEV